MLLSKKFLFRTTLSWLSTPSSGRWRRAASDLRLPTLLTPRPTNGTAPAVLSPRARPTGPRRRPTARLRPPKRDRRVAPPFDDHRPHARDDQVKSTRVARIKTHQNARRTPPGAAATDAQRLTQPQYASIRLNPPLPNLVCDAHRLSTPTTPLHAPPTSTNAVLCSSTAPPPAAGSAGPVATTGSALARAHVRPPLRRDRP
jgi:hypothetical protein